jgi:nucleoside-diphosphate-sugar epimerase
MAEVKTLQDFLQNQIIKEDMETIERRLGDCSRLNNKNILITGAYGMLAAYCVYFLIYLNETHPGYHIHILAQGRNRDKMCQRFGVYLSKDYFSFVKEDISQPVSIDADIHYIIHAASLASPQYYKTNPVDVLKPNTLGTFYLLQLAAEKNVEGFLFFSSGDIYGNIGEDMDSIDERCPGRLDSMELRNCYGESKRMGENMCAAFWQQYGVPAKCVRITHTYGPTMDLENDRRLFSEFVSNVVSGQDIVMKSDGTAIRPMCYIADAADAFFRTLLDADAGRAYNLCNNMTWISVKELAELLISLYPEKNLRVVCKERESNSDYMECRVKFHAKFDTEALQSLGWKPEYGLREGFKRTIDSFFM